MTAEVGDGTTSPSEEWSFDAFISHASEDKESIARPLAIELIQRGLAVWFDAFELTVGDNLRRRIDDGLRESAFGVVVLSEAFFAKEWAQKELDGLVSRDEDKDKVILPVWHGVSPARVREFSPVLAGKLAANTEHGIAAVADELVRAMQREKDNATTRVQAAKSPASVDAHAINSKWIADSRNPRDEQESVQTQFEETADQVCILCAELIGAAAFKARHNSIDSFEKVYTHNSCVREIVESPPYRGRVPKFKSDGVLAYFCGEDAAERGIRAAAAVIERIRKENKDQYWSFPKEMSTRIGVDYGPVWMMKFGPQATDDPQGLPVDTALQLARLAGSGQIVATQEAFASVKSDDVFANRQSATYTLPGTREPKNLVSVAMPGDPAPRIVLPGGTVDCPENVRRFLDKAEGHWRASQDAARNRELAADDSEARREQQVAEDELKESIRRYRDVLAIDALNFDANFYLAEHLALHVRNMKKERKHRLDEAQKLLQVATSERAEACFGWKLLSWVRFRQYRYEDSVDLTILNEAIGYASHSLRIAQANKDAYGAAIARIYLLIYYYFRISRPDVSRDQKDKDIAGASVHVENVQSTLDAGLGKWLRSQFTMGEALIGLLAGKYHEDAAIIRLRNAQNDDPQNRLAAELIVELMDGTDFGPSTGRAR